MSSARFRLLSETSQSSFKKEFSVEHHKIQVLPNILVDAFLEDAAECENA
jgi:hypothetical protein